MGAIGMEISKLIKGLIIQSCILTVVSDTYSGHEQVSNQVRQGASSAGLEKSSSPVGTGRLSKSASNDSDCHHHDGHSVTARPGRPGWAVAAAGPRRGSTIPASRTSLHRPSPATVLSQYSERRRAIGPGH
eukprot:501770-Hanusia_phi.AAC.6